MSKSPHEEQVPPTDTNSSDELSEEQLEEVAGGSTVLEERPSPLRGTNERGIIINGIDGIESKIGSGKTGGT